MFAFDKRRTNTKVIQRQKLVNNLPNKEELKFTGKLSCLYS